MHVAVLLIIKDRYTKNVKAKREGKMKKLLMTSKQDQNQSI